MQETKGVEELHGFVAAEGDPDVRGWEVVSRDGSRVGEVADVLEDGEDRSVRYFQVRLDGPAGEESVLGQADVAGDGPPEQPARSIGEALVRDSLLDIENRMTSSGGGFEHGGRRVLIPAGQAHLEPGQRRVRLDSLPAGPG